MFKGYGQMDCLVHIKGSLQVEVDVPTISQATDDQKAEQVPTPVPVIEPTPTQQFEEEKKTPEAPIEAPEPPIKEKVLPKPVQSKPEEVKTDLSFKPSSLESPGF